MENIEAIQAKEYFLKQRKKFLSYFEKKDQVNIELSKKEYLEWIKTFCKESSNETLIAFIVHIRDEIKGKDDALSIEFDAILPIKNELYDRAISNMKLKISERAIALVNEGLRLIEYYDRCDLEGKTTLEIPEEIRKPLDEYINKVLRICTLEESIVLLSLFDDCFSEYVQRKNNKGSFTRGYNIKYALTKSIKDNVLEESYLGQKEKEYFFMQRNKFLNYSDKKNKANIELSKKEFSEWRETFCKESSNEKLIAFIKLIKEEMKDKYDLLIDLDAIIPVKFELYNRAISNMNLKINERVTKLVNEGLHLIEYYDGYDLQDAKPLEIPEDVHKPLDEYINKVQKSCTLEEAVVLLSLFEDVFSEYVQRKNHNKDSFIRGYNVTSTLRNNIKERVLEETYFKQKKKEKNSKRSGKVLVKTNK